MSPSAGSDVQRQWGSYRVYQWRRWNTVNTVVLLGRGTKWLTYMLLFVPSIITFLPGICLTSHLLPCFLRTLVVVYFLSTYLTFLSFLVLFPCVLLPTYFPLCPRRYWFSQYSVSYLCFPCLTCTRILAFFYSIVSHVFLYPAGTIIRSYLSPISVNAAIKRDKKTWIKRKVDFLTTCFFV